MCSHTWVSKWKCLLQLPNNNQNSQKSQKTQTLDSSALSHHVNWYIGTTASG
jgi:hypothetical protein